MVPPGEEVRVLVRDTERGEGPARLGARIATGDLRGPEDLRKPLAGMDAVVHLAVFPDGSQKGTTPARAAAEAGATRFVQASTNLVYGEGRGRPLVESLRRAPGVGGPASGARRTRSPTPRRCRRWEEPGFRPQYPSVRTARDAGAL